MLLAGWQESKRRQDRRGSEGVGGRGRGREGQEQDQGRARAGGAGIATERAAGPASRQLAKSSSRDPRSLAAL